MSDFDGERLRSIMRRVATPVTVITFIDRDRPRGITIGSFTSVSLDPPLISFNVSRASSLHDRLVAVDRLVVNVLSDDQAALGNHFAASDLTVEEQFDPVPTASSDAIPYLSEASAALDCEVLDRHPAGDSTIIVARVQAAHVDEQRRPLLYFDRTYREVGAEREPSLFEPVNRSSSASP